MKSDRTGRREFLKKFAALSAAPLFFAGCDSVEPLYGVEPMYGVRTDPGGTLSGKVTSDGEPLNNIKISFKDHDISSLTSEQGSYSFLNIAQGTYTIIASGDGYVTREKQADIVINQVTTLDFELRKKT